MVVGTKYMFVGTKTYLFIRTKLWLWKQKPIILGTKLFLGKKSMVGERNDRLLEQNLW
jgi:hypothetical protein